MFATVGLGIEPILLNQPVRSIVTIPTDLSRLSVRQTT